MSDGIIMAGAVGRLKAATSVDGSTNYIPVYQGGHMVKATANQIASGADAVDGPASSTDNAIARFDSTTGKIIQNSATTVADTTGAISIPGTTNQLVLGTTNTITISAVAPAASRVVSIQDPGASADLVATAGTQTIGGAKTFSTAVTVNPVTNQIVLGTTNTTTINATAPIASRVITMADPGGADSFAYLAATQSLTNKTVAGGTNTIAGAIMSDIKRTTSAVTKNGSAAYANVTGLSQIVVPGTYRFVCRLPSTVASGTGGIKYAFNYTTTVLTSIESTSRGFTAAAVATQHTTTTTTQTDLFTQADVVIYVEIVGSMVVSTGGTIDLQMAQNTSNASDTIALIGGTMEFERIV